MDTANVPNNKHEATIYLKAQKAAMMALLEDMTTDNLDITQVHGWLYNEIDKIDEVL